MRLSILFGLLCFIFIAIYAVGYTMMVTTPAIAAGLSPILLLSGWGAGIFFILAIVMLVLHK